MQTLRALRLQPRYEERIWGGHHLRPETQELIGEAWIVHEDDVIASGNQVGRSLREVADEYGADLLGTHVLEETGLRFPLLVKLLDCGEWLSLQVHPDDQQAEHLEGPGHFGKTEAWYVLRAEPGAQLISGLKPGTAPGDLEKAIREGTVIELAQYLQVKTGDTIMTRAGTVHALGPGLLIYEVQQTSDITYRIFDWNRPQEQGRKLHIEQSVAVANASASGRLQHAIDLPGGSRKRLLACPYFALDLLHSATEPIILNTGNTTFHAITAAEGVLQVEGNGWCEQLKQYETAIVPACAGAYRIVPLSEFNALLAYVE